MGKAARNRAKRQHEEEIEREREAVREGVLELLKLEDSDAFLALLARRPEMLEELALEEIEHMAEAPGYGPLFTGVHPLLKSATSSDLRTAWEVFARERRATNARATELETQQNQIDAAELVGDLPSALELIDLALPIAIEIGFGQIVCELLHRRGRLLLRLSTARRAEELEEALECFEAALEVAVLGEQAARILMHRGLAYGERVAGDPSQNIDRAIASLRDGLAQLSESDDDELRAMMQTNLAVALTRSRRHDRLAAAHDAVELCRRALAYRSPERDADNWAYTQINLGYALRILAELGVGDPEEALAAYETVLTQSDAITDKALVGGAHHALGRLSLRAAAPSPEQMIQADDAGRLDELFDNRAALLSAREHLEAALALTPRAPDTLGYARILDDLTSALDQLGEDDEALALAREGLDLVSPQSSPVTCKALAWRVAAILSKREDWREAASAFATSLTAAQITVNAHIGSTGRASEVREIGNLHRWAAYTFARAGDPQAAAEALDSGRARELQQRLGLSGEDEALLDQVPDELREGYEAALTAFLATPIDVADTDASRRLGEAIAAIRELPGFASFQAGARWPAIAAAIERAWPLVYVNPTPQGTLLLVLSQQHDGEVVAEAQFIAVTSTEVFMHMMVNGGRRLDGAEPNGSYLLAASAQGTARDVAGGLDRLLPWLSQMIAVPVMRLLESFDARAATLVLCGPLDMAPLHAVPLPSDVGVLADRLELRYAPSASVCAAAIERARIASETPHRLVALADPDGTLPAARPEVKEIATVFDGDTSACAVGSAATLKFLERNAARASHLHLACHARSGVFDAGEATIELASGPLPASALTAVARLKTRLVVVSACQSAQSTMGGLLQAEFSIAAALLAAGSACVIASLWPVDDLATALLMTRLYQELDGVTTDPPRALRSAQAWLRDLSEAQEQAFLDRHPELAAEYARRITEGNPPGRRGGPTSPSAAGASRPYAHADYWAAFIAIGV